MAIADVLARSRPYGQPNLPVDSGGRGGGFYIPGGSRGNPLTGGGSSFGGMRIPTGPLQSESDLRSGYAASENPYLDDYNNQMADKIAKERWWETNFGLTGAANPARADAVSAQNPYNMRRDILHNTVLGTHSDPTYGGARTGVNDALSAFSAGGAYRPQNVSAERVGVNGANQDQIRGMQLGNLGVLKAASLGEGPSAAQAQLQRGSDANIAQQMSLAAAARGVSGGAAQRNARNQAALIQQRTGQDAAALRAQEMQAAMQLYTGALVDTRGQDLTFSGQQLQASMANQDAFLRAAMSNQSAGLQAQGINNQYELGLRGQQFQYASLDQQRQQQQIQDLMALQAQADANWQASKGRQGTGFARQVVPILQSIGGVASAGAGIAGAFGGRK